MKELGKEAKERGGKRSKHLALGLAPLPPLLGGVAGSRTAAWGSHTAAPRRGGRGVGGRAGGAGGDEGEEER